MADELVKGEQTGMLGVPGKTHTQKRSWTPGQMEFGSYGKLKQAKEQATAPKANEFKKKIALLKDQLDELEDKRKESSMSASEAQAELEVAKDWLKGNKRIAKLTELIPQAKMAEGELAYITLGQYRKYWGREPKAVILAKGGKRVRWEYALDELAQELGLERQYGSKADEALRDLIMLAKNYKDQEQELITSLAVADEEIKEAEGKLETVTVHLGRREQVADVQEERSARAIAIDKSKQAMNVLLFPEVGKWLKKPGRYDIRGVDTRVKPPAKRKAKPKKVRRQRTRTIPSISGVR